ncbi:MAG: GIY-YIG nuclease family protein [Bacteroidia bacterium]
MTKDEYFEEGKKKNLPKRCPLVGKCERNINTTAYLTELYKYGSGDTLLEILQNSGYFSDTKQSEIIGQKSTPFAFSHSENVLNFYDACPEVSLFDRSIFSLIPKKPIIDGAWDNFYEENHFGKDGKFQVIKEGHFSDCAEFLITGHETLNTKAKLVKPKLFIYLMKNFQNGYFKIGESNNPEYREKTLQAQEPDIKLIEAWLAPSRVEKELHKKFADKRLRGEWFNLNENDVEEILQTMKNYPKD